MKRIFRRLKNRSLPIYPKKIPFLLEVPLETISSGYYSDSSTQILAEEEISSSKSDEEILNIRKIRYPILNKLAINVHLHKYEKEEIDAFVELLNQYKQCLIDHLVAHHHPNPFCFKNSLAKLIELIITNDLEDSGDQLLYYLKQLSNCNQGNIYSMRIIEICLQTIFCMVKMNFYPALNMGLSITKLDKLHLRNKYLFGNFSPQIKLAYIMILCYKRMDLISPEKIFLVLLDILEKIENENIQIDNYLESFGIDLVEFKDLWNHMMKFLEDWIYKLGQLKSGQEDEMNVLNTILCKLIKMNFIGKYFHSETLLKLPVVIIDTFSYPGHSNVLDKLLKNEFLCTSDKTVINCFCSSFNLIGKIAEYLNASDNLENTCKTIFHYLRTLEKCVEKFFALRIVEVLLYCLCNIVKNDDLLKRYMWNDILYKYYKKCRGSQSIQMAAAFCVVSLLSHSTKIRNEKKFKDAREYLNTLLNEMKKNNEEEYLGFSQQEIEQALNNASIDEFMLEMDQKYHSIISMQDQKFCSLQDKVVVNNFYRSIKNLNNCAYGPVNLGHISRKLISYLNGLLDHVPGNISAMRLCEACLYLICEIQKSIDVQLPHVIFVKCFQGNYSPEIKLAVTVAHSRMDKFTNQEESVSFLLDILDHFFDENGKMDERKFYLGFSYEEIIRCVEREIKNFSQWVHRLFYSEENQQAKLELLNKILCQIVKMNPETKDCHQMDLPKLCDEILKLFTVQFKQNIINKFKNKEPFDMTERAAINCFCNCLNIIGSVVSNWYIESSMLNTIYETMEIFLTLLEDFTHENIFATRIVEVLLYCLCNVIKNEDLIRDCDLGDILWSYYQTCRTSQLIKLAAAFSIVSFKRNQEQTLKNEKVPEEFLESIFLMMEESNMEEYLGFSLLEMKDKTNKKLPCTLEQIFCPTIDEGQQQKLLLLNKILCQIIEWDPDTLDSLKDKLMELTNEIIRLFTIQFEQNIMKKFKEKEPFDNKEQTAINCFCNSLNLIGQIIPKSNIQSETKNICDTILNYLKLLKIFVEENIFAVRIVEVLLYCLCNVVKKREVLLECESEDILWRYYGHCKLPQGIKLAAAFCLVSLDRKIKRAKKESDIKETKKYFKKILKEMRKSKIKEFLGFSEEEIVDSLS